MWGRELCQGDNFSTKLSNIFSISAAYFFITKYCSELSVCSDFTIYYTFFFSGVNSVCWFSFLSTCRESRLILPDCQWSSCLVLSVAHLSSAGALVLAHPTSSLLKVFNYFSLLLKCLVYDMVCVRPQTRQGLELIGTPGKYLPHSWLVCSQTWIGSRYVTRVWGQRAWEHQRVQVPVSPWGFSLLEIPLLHCPHKVEVAGTFYYDCLWCSPQCYRDHFVLWLGVCGDFPFSRTLTISVYYYQCWDEDWPGAVSLCSRPGWSWAQWASVIFMSSSWGCRSAHHI